MVQSFRDLGVWQKAMDLADAVYTATAKFPREELFGLSAQLRKCAVSIPSNIAEGRSIGGGRFLHHLRIAIGSEAELETQVELAVRRSYVTREAADVLISNAVEIRRMLHSMHRTLKARRAAAITTAIILVVAYSSAVLT